MYYGALALLIKLITFPKFVTFNLKSTNTLLYNLQTWKVAEAIAKKAVKTNRSHAAYHRSSYTYIRYVCVCCAVCTVEIIRSIWMLTDIPFENVSERKIKWTVIAVKSPESETKANPRENEHHWAFLSTHKFHQHNSIVQTVWKMFIAAICMIIHSNYVLTHYFFVLLFVCIILAASFACLCSFYILTYCTANNLIKFVRARSSRGMRRNCFDSVDKIRLHQLPWHVGLEISIYRNVTESLDQCIFISCGYTLGDSKITQSTMLRKQQTSQPPI